ncbi:MAG TPA: ATP-dependent DNA ligase [Solirubrobacter sp.]|nr:ATP-dependent DNA ligase [Solirubrobacter sp.]
MLVDGRAVRITNPDRELLPGVTKQAALDYFLAVGDGILAALRGRPVMLERRRDDEVFFQRRLPKGAPEWVTTVRLASYDAVCPEELAVVAWMVNLGTVTFHPWPVHRDALGRPDQLLIDLDPQPGTGFADAVLVARVLREVLAENGLDGYPKTSGGRGLHVIAPIEPRPWREVQALREAIGLEVVARLPGLATMERLKRDRGARVYVDCGPQTVASAYSLRPGALVSAPVRWEELGAVEPEDFTIATMPERFARVGELMP